MTLNNFYFILSLIVLVAVLFFLQILRKNQKIENKCSFIQRLVLLIFSYICIYYVNWKFWLCIVGYTIFIYIFAIAVEKKSKKALFAGITLSVIMLAYFKYVNFFLLEISKLFGNDRIVLNIILPLGISFYTFSGMSYLIDVYRGKYEAEKNILSVALYIALFSKLTAGPIVRGEVFFEQIKKYRGIELSSFLEGIQIFVFGLFKKMVLADHLGVFVDDVFYAPMAYNTGTVIWAVISYSLQIYFDFSGYSDMAIGISKIIGFDFQKNFNMPYIAKGMSDFWKRWHISLSSWFQDYLYIPLGGSRKGNVRTYINLLIVMTISGLWHGAAITFIVWGVLHGVASCISRMITKSGKVAGKVIDIFRVIATYVTVTLLWVVFRASDILNAIEVWKSMFTIHSGISQPYSWTFFALVCLIISELMAICKSKKKRETYINGYYPVMDLTSILNLTIFFTFIGLTILMGYYGNTAFIYGKF